MFRGLAFCGKCHAPITYTKNHGKHFIGICSTYKKLGKSYCNNVNLKENYLIETVFNNLRTTIKEFVKQDSLKVNKPINSDYSKQIAAITSKLKENENYLVNLYKDKVNGNITDELFKTLSDEISKEKSMLEDNFKILKESNSNPTDEKEIRKIIKELLELNPSNIDRNLLLKLINKIEIDNKNQIKIFYNFKNPSES